MIADARGGDVTENFFSERFNTPTGWLHIVTDVEQKLRAVHWENNGEDKGARVLRVLRLQYGEHGFQLDDAQAPSDARRALEAYFEGQIAAIEAIRTQTRGTDFQFQVWAALREIPTGATLSYGKLAAKIGRPAAVRAVGAANGANPIPVVVPCHRVIGADASLTGFGGGLERKRWLLLHERAHTTSPVPYNLELRI